MRGLWHSSSLHYANSHGSKTANNSRFETSGLLVLLAALLRSGTALDGEPSGYRASC